MHYTTTDTIQYNYWLDTECFASRPEDTCKTKISEKNIWPFQYFPCGNKIMCILKQAVCFNIPRCIEKSLKSKIRRSCHCKITTPSVDQNINLYKHCAKLYSTTDETIQLEKYQHWIFQHKKLCQSQLRLDKKQIVFMLKHSALYF